MAAVRQDFLSEGGIAPVEDCTMAMRQSLGLAQATSV